MYVFPQRLIYGYISLAIFMIIFLLFRNIRNVSTSVRVHLVQNNKQRFLPYGKTFTHFTSGFGIYLLCIMAFIYRSIWVRALDGNNEAWRFVGAQKLCVRVLHHFVEQLYTCEILNSILHSSWEITGNIMSAVCWECAVGIRLDIYDSCRSFNP